MASFKLDEGFSEAYSESTPMEVQGGDGESPSQITKATVEEWIMAQHEDARKGRFDSLTRNSNY